MRRKIDYLNQPRFKTGLSEILQATLQTSFEFEMFIAPNWRGFT